MTSPPRTQPVDQLSAESLGLLEACRKPQPSDPNWRASHGRLGEALPCQCGPPGACPEPCPPSTALASGEGGQRQLQSHTPRGPASVQGAVGNRPGLAGAPGRGVGTSRPEVCPAGPPQHLAPLVQTWTPTHPLLLLGHPPDPAFPALTPFTVPGTRAGEEGAPPWTPRYHPPPSPTAQHTCFKVQMVQQSVCTHCPPLLGSEACTPYTVPTRWRHPPKGTWAQGSVWGGTPGVPTAGPLPGQQRPARLHRHSLEA